jgi:anti-sigma regulatory factor (Ser/Thr protein kinase)
MCATAGATVIRMTGSPDGVEAFSVEADVPGGPHAAAQARRLVEAELAGRVPRDLLGDVCLLVTELVANVVHHGGGAVGASLRLRLQGRRPGLHVEVVNAAVTPEPVAQRRPDLGGGGGIGLHLVERLATRWGVREARPTAVWFEMDC